MLGGVAAGDSKRPALDRRVLRTRTTLQRTLIELVEERELSQIAIADVAERAGMSRSTFYDHYRDVHELAEAACTAMIDDLIETLPTAATGNAQSPAASLTRFFTNFADHAGLYRSLLGPHGSARILDHIRCRMTATVHAGINRAGGRESARAQSDPPEDSAHDVPAAFIAGALIGVATDWLQRGCPGTPAQTADLTWPILAAAHNGSCSPPG